jgi:hypothetical protein
MQKRNTVTLGQAELIDYEGEELDLHFTVKSFI